jgi:ornithine cyclodeaminase/alanine dehydrogenase-like protein (mu-crystallin family)
MHLLIMPAWRPRGIVGVKLVTAYPNNNRIELPSISAVYVAFEAAHGQALAMIDGLTLTTRRTAAASALAMSRLLSKKAQRLAVIGTGSLCLDIIEAHNSCIPVQKDRSARYIAQANREKLGISGMEKIVAFDQNQSLDDFMVLPEANNVGTAHGNGVVTFPGNFGKKT